MKSDYYPFGLQYQSDIIAGTPKNKCLYNGKELQDGTNLYDYGARLYDPLIGRWGAVDPMAEMYQDYSPFNYTANNPIKYIDPNGMWIGDYYDEFGNWLFNDKIDDDKVYLQDVNGETNVDNLGSFTELDISHTEFQTISSIVMHEAGTSDISENLWIAHTSRNAASASGTSLYNKLMSGYSSAPK